MLDPLLPVIPEYSYGPQLPWTVLATHRGPVPLGGALDGAAEDVLGTAVGGELDVEAGGELAGGSDGRVDCGCDVGHDDVGDDSGPECPVQRTGSESAGHFGAEITETWVSLPDARQA